MHILMISDVFFPRINGVSTSIETFRQSLAPLGIRSTLIAPAYPGAAPDNDPDILRIASRYLPMDPEDRLMRRSAIRALWPTLRSRGIDLVHVHTPFAAHYAGLEIARTLGVPCVATYHTFFEEYFYHYIPFLPKNWLRRAARRFSRAQCNQLDAVIVPSTSMADILRGYGVTRPLHVLPTGLPARQFVGGDGCYFRNRYGIAKDRRLLLFVGRVAHEKNIGFLIDMIAHLKHREPKAMLLITGEGPALPALTATVQRRGLDEHVRFLGYLDRNSELHDCYRAADLFVFASRTETQGLVLLEAMALGTPVVAVAELGTRDILGPQQGARIAPADAQAFAKIVAELLADEPRLKALSVDAHRYARGWAAENMASKLAALYRDWVSPAAALLDHFEVRSPAAGRTATGSAP